MRTPSVAVVRSAIIVAALTGCVPGRHREPLAPLRTPARDSLLAADLHRVDTLTARGIAETRSSYFAPDIVYLRAGAPAVFGRDNVVAFLAANSTAETPIGWQPLGGALSRDGMSGYTFGVAVYAAAEQRAPSIARYIAFWNRPRGGAWKIAAYAEVGQASPVATTQPTSGIDIPRRQPSRDVDRAAIALARADSDFAEASSLFGVPAAFADAVAADGVLVGGLELVVGPRAVREYFEAQRGLSLTWHPIYAAVAASGDLGFTIGESVSTSRGPSGAAAQRFGKYLTIWRKEPNGSWKFVVDGGNARPSPVGQ